MKRSINNKNKWVACVLLFAIVAASACIKDKSGIPEGSASQNPVITSFEVDSASNGNVVIAKGSGLFDIRSVVFDKNGAPATFNTNLNSDNAIVFRVPDTAAGGLQKIVLTNSLGKSASADFKVIALASVAKSNAYSFKTDEQITLTGRFLDDVSKVVFEGTSTDVPIVSKTKTTLTLKIPATTASTVKLSITNASGTVTTTQEFVNAGEAYVFFREGYENGYGDASWGDGGVISSTEFASGTKSLGKKFAKSNWHNLGFGWTKVAKGPYQNVSFWIKGGLIDHDVWVFANSTGGSGKEQAQPASNKIVVKAGVWQYFKLPLAPLNLWADGNAGNGFTIEKFGFFLKGPDNADETLYVDDVMFIK